MKSFTEFLTERTNGNFNLTAKDLKLNQTYLMQTEDGQSFKAVVTDVMKDRGEFKVSYIYSDNSYAKKGTEDAFAVKPNDKVFAKV